VFFFFYSIIFLFKEKRRLSRGEVTLNIPTPTNENGHRISQHDALALTPSVQLSSDSDKSISFKKK